MCVVFGTVPPTLLLFTYIIYKEEKPRRHVRDFFILKLKSRRLAAANEEQIKGKPVHIHFRSLCLAVVCVHIPLRISQRRSMLVLINRSFEFKKREDFVCWTIATRIISFYLIKFEGGGRYKFVDLSPVLFAWRNRWLRRHGDVLSHLEKGSTKNQRNSRICIKN